MNLEVKMRRKGSANSEDSLPRLLVGPAAEFLFVLLPLCVLTIVFLANGKPVRSILASAEWSFGASILFGQGVIKLASGAIRFGIKKGWETLVLIISIAIVLGLVPSLTVLSQVLTNDNPGTGLIVGQLGLFVFGTLAFFFLGALGHYGLFHHE